MPAGRAVIGLGLVLLVASAAPANAGVPVIAIDGRGWGHGVGMAQDGALQMGRQGAALGQILGQFYPGTSLGHASGDVRVPVLTGGPPPTSAQVMFPDGGQVVDARSGRPSPGFPLQVPAGGSVTFAWDGAVYKATVDGASPAAAMPMRTTPTTQGLLPTVPSTEPATTTTTRPATTTSTVAPRSPAPASASSRRTLWAVPAGRGAIGVPGRGRSYRGAIEATGADGTLRLVDDVDVDTYLVGMGEVRDPSWPLASLETQEVAARTYALRAMAAGGELCDDTRCQVYLGVDGEYPAAQQAVSATSGQVLVSGGGLADAVYSANAAGFTASAEEGFGTSGRGFPYLRPAPYPTSDPMRWTVEFATADVAAKFGLHGPLTNIAVTGTGPSGRAMAVTLTAGSETTVVSGLAFAAGLGLRSTMIDGIRPEVATVAPAPPGGSTLQVPPDLAAGVAPRMASQRAASSVWVDGAALPAFAAGPLPISRSTGAPLGLILLAVALLGVTGAGVFSSRPSRRPASRRRRPSPRAYRR